jgi:tetratricopeptide (TPR) repeat protein
MIMRQTRRTTFSARTLPTIAAIAIALAVAACSHKSVDDYLTAGNEAMQSTRLADAENAYQSATKAAPNDPRPHLALGNLYIFQQKQGPAELEYMKVIELDPKNPAAHAALGNLYASESQFGLAEAQLRAAVALDPVKAVYRMNLGTALQKAQKSGPAEAEFRTAVGLEPKNVQAHLALANLLNAEPSRQTEAQAEYAQVKALDPSLMPASATAAASGVAPVGSPTTVASAVPPPTALKIRDLQRKFQLTHDSPVYQSPDQTAQVVSQVHRRKYVSITGMSSDGNWFRIQLHNGTVGFIPVTAAE